MLSLSRVKNMKTEEFVEWLRTHKNSEKIPAMENYMRNQFKFLGLQATERRQLTKEFLNEKRAETHARAQIASPQQSILDWEFLFLLWKLPEREFQLIGLDYLKRAEKYLVLEDFTNLRQLVLTKSWWDTVDFLAKNIGGLVLKEPLLTNEMKKWSVDDNIWLRRVSILHQLAFKEQTDPSLLRTVILNNLEDPEFFIQKAIGWALREYAKTDACWVRHFVKEFENELSSLSQREALKNLNG